MNASLLSKALNAFKKLHILVVGDLLLDEYLMSEVTRISPEAPIPVARVVEERYTLGGAANVAHNLSRLGIQTDLLGLMGNDPPGKRFRALLEAERIGHEGVISHDDIFTIQKTRVVSQSQQLLRIDREYPTSLFPKHLARRYDFLEKKIPHMNAVVLSDYAKGVLHPTLVKKVISLCQQYKVPVLVDPKPIHRSFYKGVTVLMPNHHEAEQLVHLRETDEKSLVRIGKKIQKQWRCNVIITCGARGMLVFEGSNVIKVETMVREVYDVTGAGDTASALVAAGLAAGLSLSDAACLASVGAGIVVEKFGTATVTLDELRNALTAYGS